MFVGLFVCLFVCFDLFLEGWSKSSSVRPTARARVALRACISVRLAGEECFMILPLQRIEGHMQAIKIIDIGRHKQRVM